jgi:hypothetical protein
VLLLALDQKPRRVPENLDLRELFFEHF